MAAAMPATGRLQQYFATPSSLTRASTRISTGTQRIHTFAQRFPELAQAIEEVWRKSQNTHDLPPLKDYLQKHWSSMLGFVLAAIPTIAQYAPPNFSYAASLGGLIYPALVIALAVNLPISGEVAGTVIAEKLEATSSILRARGRRVRTLLKQLTPLEWTDKGIQNLESLFRDLSIEDPEEKASEHFKRKTSPIVRGGLYFLNYYLAFVLGKFYGYITMQSAEAVKALCANNSTQGAFCSISDVSPVTQQVGALSVVGLCAILYAYDLNQEVAQRCRARRHPDDLTAEKLTAQLKQILEMGIHSEIVATAGYLETFLTDLSVEKSNKKRFKALAQDLAKLPTLEYARSFANRRFQSRVALLAVSTSVIYSLAIVPSIMDAADQPPLASITPKSELLAWGASATVGYFCIVSVEKGLARIRSEIERSRRRALEDRTSRWREGAQYLACAAIVCCLLSSLASAFETSAGTGDTSIANQALDTFNLNKRPGDGPFSWTAMIGMVGAITTNSRSFLAIAHKTIEGAKVISHSVATTFTNWFYRGRASESSTRLLDDPS